MIWLIVGIIVAILMFFAFKDREEVVFICMTAIIFLFALGNFFGKTLVTFVAEETIVEEYEIYSVNTETSISGSSYLGTGSINSEEVYYYYVQNSDGSYSRESIPVDEVTIIEDDTVTPKMQVREYKGAIWFYIGSINNYVLYVPTGTVTATN